MKKEKSALLGNVLGSVLMILAGIVLLFRPDFGSAAVAAVIGWAVIAAGGLGLLVTVLSWPVLGAAGAAVSGVGLCFGIYLVKNPLSLASVLGLVLGIYLAIQGAGGLLESLKLKQGGFDYRSNLLLAVVMLAFGVILIVSPLSASKLVMTVCGIALLICGVTNLVFRSRAARQLRSGKEKQKIIDAEE